jgi:hypothetical protein
MDHKIISESPDRLRLGTEDLPGKYVDLLSMPNALKGLPEEVPFTMLLLLLPMHNTT